MIFLRVDGGVIKLNTMIELVMSKLTAGHYNPASYSAIFTWRWSTKLARLNSYKTYRQR